MMVLRDWRNGTFSGYTMPPVSERQLASPSTTLQDIYKRSDSSILSQLPLLRDLLSGDRLRNLVRLEPGNPWAGTVDLVATYSEPSESTSEISEESESEGEDDEDTFMGLGDPANESEEESEESDADSDALSESPPPITVKKRKAESGVSAARTKRVAFSKPAVSGKPTAPERVSKTKQKARNQAAALARSQQMQKPSSLKPKTSAPAEKPLKVANAPTNSGTKKRLVSASLENSSDMAYDFSTHFKGI
jgi:hypothetical protein